MFKWLLALRERWHQGRGGELFKRLCLAASNSERRRLGGKIEDRAVPAELLGWRRFYMSALRSLANQVSPNHMPAETEFKWVFNQFFREFAMQYPGMVPDNVPPSELADFARRTAFKVAANI
jgi:hypothetical protein